MTDYIEGVLDMERMFKDLRSCLLKRDYMEARRVISQLRYMSYQVDDQIVKQYPVETGH